MSLEHDDRPWGSYDVLEDSDTHKVKRIDVTPGQRLSYQRHARRAEHWFVVAGRAEVTLGGETIARGEGRSKKVAEQLAAQRALDALKAEGTSHKAEGTRQKSED